MTLMNREVKEDWLKALRSGKYKQSTGVLRRSDETGFCCLGVLCDLMDPSAWMKVEKEEGTIYAHKGRTDIPSDSFARLVDLSAGEMASLATMNDQGKTFTEIADYIEQNL